MLTPRQAALRLLITDFLSQRLESKLEKLPPDDPKRADLQRDFAPAAWLEDAARRAAQIQVVTHSLKPIHPEAKGTNLYCPPDALAPVPVVGSHCLTDDFAGDVVGNAAALDVYKFLKQEHEGQTLLALAVSGDVDWAQALSDDPAQAQAWMSAFASLATPHGNPTSHTLAKQLYWPVGDDLHDDAGYHLLAPLYASSLAHRLYQTLQDDRFSDEAKAAREARKADLVSERPVRDYPNLAVQQLGGTKPQNISQLNSERRGQNSLLASLPPMWRSVELKPLWGTESMFPRYKSRPAVKENLGALLAFLKTDPKRNVDTRDRRAAYVDNLIDDFLQFTAEVRTLEPGWSCNNKCRLPAEQAYWLDPEGAAQADAELGRPPPTDTHERICEAYANWLNAQLRDPLPMGDPEFEAWRKAMQEHILAEEREGLHAD
ncbi:CRISPR-associated protein Csy1 [Candidatus Symbiobacter mobilis CR]|uniref:CRISPR-associated protein Csy1 n=2 Tax=Candidatus Symbiobacter TaxID=1436289 RepID=U5NDG4_9BURK|nr:CRISPR-associated protein Csy1 [Candidatus Symbiobacter mobilis CR]